MSFFKAYDMRGTYGVDFDLPLIRKIGAALPQVVAGQRWLVGRDCRTTSEAVRAALVDGLRTAGVDVTDLGLCTTPMVYFFTATDAFDGSVMVTASHNPPSDNGLKVSRRAALPVGYADGLDRVAQRVAQMPTETRSIGSVPSTTLCDASLARYLDWQRAHNPTLATINATLRFAVDCSNGMASLFARELFPHAVVLNDTLDGTFPAHSPNPLAADARAQIAAVVRAQKLDCGVIFDGDADRAMFVDEHGDFVQPDYLIPLVARATAGAHHGVVLHDVRTSRGVIETLREDGFETAMVPVGHAFAKPKMRELGAVCGGELAGHYYFAEFFNCDSGLLAALRILSEIARAKADGHSFSRVMSPIVSRFANSGELNFRVDDKDAAIARVLSRAASFGSETSRSTMDGVRVEFTDGWISVRKSNTEPYLRLLVECRTREQMAAWVDALREAIERTQP